MNKFLEIQGGWKFRHFSVWIKIRLCDGFFISEIKENQRKSVKESCLKIENGKPAKILLCNNEAGNQIYTEFNFKNPV